ncbi:MAG: sugar phosphate isomerase/epimerase [SAR324 cluster bacterium]|nr:sugar phosphate isomerase/epimerase [SAR324 cluster bacterium]
MQSSAFEVGNEFSPKYSLSHLTLLDCPIPELVYIASRTGYDAISPRLIPIGTAGECPFSPLDKEMKRATRNALKLTGIDVHEIELARITDQFELKSFEAAMEFGAELGARHLIASAWTSRRDDHSFLVETYAQICDMADHFGLSVMLEFPSFSRLENLQEAAGIVRAANCHNGGILIDTLYMHMSRVKLTELASLPSKWFDFIHISDVLPGVPDTRAGMIQIAREARLYPGEGCIDFEAIIESLPPVNYSIETPNRSRVAELGYEEHARHCLQAAKRSFGMTKSRRIPLPNRALMNNQNKKEHYGSHTN